MYMFTVFQRLNVIFSCFRQLPLKFTYILLTIDFTAGARVLLRGLMTSLLKPLDFHSAILSVLPIF